MILLFPNCGLWRAYHSYLIKKSSPLEKGIMEGENPVPDLILDMVKCYVFLRVGLFENATQSWVVNSI